MTDHTLTKGDMKVDLEDYLKGYLEAITPNEKYFMAYTSFAIAPAAARRALAAEAEVEKLRAKNVDLTRQIKEQSQQIDELEMRLERLLEVLHDE